MVEIEKPRIECIEKPGDNSYGKCIVEPLERGYGTTLGNSLRRILLSSLPGTAVTSIKIAGVQHEYTTIPGVTHTPEPTVRPPSRMAKRSFSSIAIGVISVHSIVTLSPGITISTPSGSLMLPVTSVVRK